MPMTGEQRREAKRAAKEFAARLASERYAEFCPDSWESMTDEQIRFAMEQLRFMPRIRREKDGRWVAV